MSFTLRGFRHSAAGRVARKATPPWGDMAAAGATESGAGTLDSNYMIAQKTLLLTNCYTKSCIGLCKVGVGCDRGR